MQRMEEDPDYIPPTHAYTANEWIEGCEEYGEDVMIHVMEKDMARYESAKAAQMAAQIHYLQNLLEENGIEYE